MSLAKIVYNKRSSKKYGWSPSWLGMTGFNERYNGAVKPIKVVHFHPNDERQWNYMVEGKNDLGVKIVNDRLSNLFKKHNCK